MYQGLHLLSIRQFKRAGELFIDALSTFTATELLTYNDFVSLTVIAGTLTLKRPDLKKKVRKCHVFTFASSDDSHFALGEQIIAAPEVIQILPELTILSDLTKSLYDSHYDKFFVALGT